MALTMPYRNATRPYVGDPWLLVMAAVLIAFGLVMMTSASIEIASRDNGDALYYFKRQLVFLGLGLCCAFAVAQCPMRYWYKCSVALLMLAYLLLILVLVPGIGYEAGGGRRWFRLGFMGMQASEVAKLLIVVFMAWFLGRIATWCATRGRLRLSADPAGPARVVVADGTRLRRSRGAQHCGVRYVVPGRRESVPIHPCRCGRRPRCLAARRYIALPRHAPRHLPAGAERSVQRRHRLRHRLPVGAGADRLWARRMVRRRSRQQYPENVLLPDAHTILCSRSLPKNWAW